jgi:large conductance mechanosensitive channel
MGMLKEFREFAIKGNVADMAIGIIIGGAFGKIVTSLVSDVLMPPLGLLLGGLDFKDKLFILKAAEGKAAAITLNYGVFINAVVDFVIVAFAMFLVIKGMNVMRKKQEAAPAAPTTSEKLLTEIRDLLKK